MRANPRYSIIPAGAVTDRNLEGSDLQVLCLLGCHSDKLGWCEASSQGELAALINVSRQTVQRSIARLVSAGWVQTRTKFVSDSGRPYAPYAYRVIMDRDDPNVLPSEHQVAAEGSQEGAHPWAPLPSQEGHGCPRMHGQQESDQEETKKDSDSARVSPFSSEAESIADEISMLAGVDPAKHAKWFIDGPALEVQRWLDAGYLRWQLIEGVRRGMAKRTSPPDRITYFKPIWQRVRGEHEAGAPQPVTPSASESGTAKNSPRPGSREDRQERTTNVISRLNERAFGSQTDGPSRSGEDGGTISGLLPLPKPA